MKIRKLSDIILDDVEKIFKKHMFFKKTIRSWNGTSSSIVPSEHNAIQGFDIIMRTSESYTIEFISLYSFTSNTHLEIYKKNSLFGEINKLGFNCEVLSSKEIKPKYPSYQTTYHLVRLMLNKF